MKHCDKCKVDIRGDDCFCPLCQNNLTGNNEEAVYPVVPTIYKQFKFFFNMLIFSTISGGIVSVTINMMIPNSGFWSAFVVIGIVFFLISLAAVLKMKGNFFKNVTFHALELSLLCVILDFFIKWSGWSINYFVPIIFSVSILSLAVVAKVKRMPPEDYLVYLIMDILFGFVPMVFFFTRSISVVIPTIICMALSMITLVALIIFEGENLRIEISKRFHI